MVSCELEGENGPASPQPVVLPTYCSVQHFPVTEPRVKEYEAANSSDYGSVPETQGVLKTADPFTQTVTSRVLAACQPHPSTQQTMKTQEFTFLEEIKP